MSQSAATAHDYDPTYAGEIDRVLRKSHRRSITVTKILELRTRKLETTK